MPKFFVSVDNISDKVVAISGSDAHHISYSLRMAVGEMITVADYSGMVHECRLISLKPEEVKAEIISSFPCDTEPPYRAILYQALPKGDKMDSIIQKAVESGVYEIVPFVSERCISRPDSAAMEKKLVRWQKIAREAAMQCGRGIVPEVRFPKSYNDIFSDKGGLSFMCYEGDGTVPLPQYFDEASSLSDFDENPCIRFIIGAEGGFSNAEVEKARREGYRAVGLGRRILRCETAGAFVLACISYRFELSCGS